MIRVFNEHGNRKNKNKARLKFVMRERGFDWLRDTIEEQYQDILANGGIAMPDQRARKFRRISAGSTAIGTGESAADIDSMSPEFNRGAKPTSASRSSRATRS